MGYAGCNSRDRENNLTMWDSFSTASGYGYVSKKPGNTNKYYSESYQEYYRKPEYYESPYAFALFPESHLGLLRFLTDEIWMCCRVAKRSSTLYGTRRRGKIIGHQVVDEERLKELYSKLISFTCESFGLESISLPSVDYQYFCKQLCTQENSYNFYREVERRYSQLAELECKRIAHS